MDLHRTRQTRLHGEPEAMFRAVALNELELLGPRPNQAHIAPEQVPYLRQLVKAEPPEQPPDAGHARIPPELEHRLGELVEHVLERALGTDIHRSELEQAEWLAVEAGAALDEQRRPPVLQPDRQGDQREEQGRDDGEWNPD